MRFFRKLGRFALVIYIVQALVGISVGVYFAVTMDPAEIERMVRCVAY